MRLSWLLILLLAGLSFADSKPPEACKLLTAEDVAKVVGGGYKLIDSRGTASDNSICSYRKGSNDIVNLMVIGSPEQNAAETLAKMQQNYKNNGLAISPVTGAGDGAFYSELPKGKSLHFGKGMWHAVLDVTLNGKPDTSAEEKLAAIAYSRLP